MDGVIGGVSLGCVEVVVFIIFVNWLVFNVVFELIMYVGYVCVRGSLFMSLEEILDELWEELDEE